MKGDIHSFHMRYRGLISIHRLQRKIIFGPLRFFLLVKLPVRFKIDVWKNRALWKGTIIKVGFRRSLFGK